MPGREMLREGELLKISRKGVNSRHFVLLTDCLLYCTATSFPGLRVSYTIPLDSLQISLGSGEAETEEELEFSITSNVRSCTLRARWGQHHNKNHASKCFQESQRKERVAGGSELRSGGAQEQEGELQ